MAKFINLEELSKTTQALLSKINEQSNLKINKHNVKSELNEGTKIGSIEGIEFYAPEVDTSNFVTNDDLNLAQVAYSGSYSDLSNTPTLAPVATSGSYNDLSNTPIIPILKVTSNGANMMDATILNKNFSITDLFTISAGSGAFFFFYFPNNVSFSSSPSSLKISGSSSYDLYIYDSDGTQMSNSDTITPGLYIGSISKDRVYYFTLNYGIQAINAKNARTVNNHTVASDVPANAVFTDTVYDDTAISSRITTLENAGYQNSTQVNSAIAAAIGNINQFEVTIVTDLPTTDIDAHTIYFKSNSSSGNNVYDEYMYINNNWELIGSTQIDLTPYALSANLATVATSGDYDDLTDAPVAETDANVETMLDSFNLDYTSNTLSPNMWQGGSY